ncbi:MAG: phenylalanine--tRNA ligase subunit beta [Candidatus Methanosuratus sp.]|nr:phenylalanine--tRNA ligase subunit beta [Candidatus Methanosuratincola sp.]
MSLIGKDLSVSELEDLLTAVKCELETSNEEVVVEVTSDRPDLFSAEGVSRAIRNYLGIGSLYSFGKYPALPIDLIVSESVSSIRPLIVSAAVRGVSLNNEALRQLMQLQEKLHNTYGSNRRKASIGVYDLDKILPPIVYEARPPEEIRFTPLEHTAELDGREILELTPKGKEYGNIISKSQNYPVLIDSRGKVLSMPPIINSEDTKVSETTTNLFIDVTGLEMRPISICLNIMITSALERGGSLQYVDVRYKDRRLRTPIFAEHFQEVSLSKAREVLGLDLSISDITSLLKRMGYWTETIGDEVVRAKIPPYRVDILHEVDLIEDIMMAYGLNRVQPTFPRVHTIGKPLTGSRLRARIRDLMIGMGFVEVTTYVLSNCEMMVNKPQLPKRPFVEVVKPVSSEYTVLRDRLLPKLLDFMSANIHVEYPQKIFEYGSVVVIENGTPKMSNHLGVVASGDRVGFEEIQAVAFSLFKNLSGNVELTKASSTLFIDGRIASICVNGTEIGILGEVHPQVLVNFALSNPAVAMEIDFSKLVYLESLFRG